MPTALHEVFLEILRADPAALARLLGLPATGWRAASGDLGGVVVLERQGDLVLRDDDDHVLAVEVQRTRDAAAPKAWAFGLAALARRHTGTVTFLVLTDRPSVATWLRRGFTIAPGLSLRPYVLGPDELLQLAAERDEPTLTMLSALVQCQGSPPEHLVHHAIQASERADHAVAMLFLDPLYDLGGQVTRRILESLMKQYRTFSFPPFREAQELGIAIGLEKGIEQGIERGIERGVHAGEARLRRALLLRLLAKKFHHTDPAWEPKVQSADDATVYAWLERLLDAQQPDQVFGDG